MENWNYASRYLEPLEYFTNRAHLWRDETGELVAFLMLDHRLTCPQVRADYRHLEREMFTWAEAHWGSERMRIDTLVFDWDTGRQATLPLARRGYALDCIELGANLAAVARTNLASYPQVTITTSAFEDVPLPERSYDLVISATAFHWIDPGIGYPKIARALKPGGALALF